MDKVRFLCLTHRRSIMCEGSCQGICRRNGGRRPESCPRQDFTPLTVTIPMTNDAPLIETALRAESKAVPISIEPTPDLPVAA